MLDKIFLLFGFKIILYIIALASFIIAKGVYWFTNKQADIPL